MKRAVHGDEAVSSCLWYCTHQQWRETIEHLLRCRIRPRDELQEQLVRRAAKLSTSALHQELEGGEDERGELVTLHLLYDLDSITLLKAVAY